MFTQFGLIFFVAIAVNLVPAVGWAAKAETRPRVTLEAMLAADQDGRRKIERATQAYGVNSSQVRALWVAQNRVDKNNFRRLKEIIRVHGWPKRSVVGEKAAHVAFLVLQHGEPQEQIALLPTFREPVAQGEALRSNLALLEDRVLVDSGAKQRYGTQLFQSRDSPTFEFHPIEDEPNVDARRAEMDLEPIAEYAKRFGLIYKSSTH